jgi:hypothetical protein
MCSISMSSLFALLLVENLIGVELERMLEVSGTCGMSEGMMEVLGT